MLPAPSVQASHNCPATKVCLWERDAQHGDWWYTAGNNWSYWDDDWFGTDDTIYNDAQSAENAGTTGKGVIFYNYAGYAGSSFCLPWMSVTDFPGFDNKASSHLWSSGC